MRNGLAGRVDVASRVCTLLLASMALVMALACCTAGGDRGEDTSPPGPGCARGQVRSMKAGGGFSLDAPADYDSFMSMACVVTNLGFALDSPAFSDTHPRDLTFVSYDDRECPVTLSFSATSSMHKERPALRWRAQSDPLTITDEVWSSWHASHREVQDALRATVQGWNAQIAASEL